MSTLPMMTSSTSAASMPARLMASAMAMEPSFAGGDVGQGAQVAPDGRARGAEDHNISRQGGSPFLSTRASDARNVLGEDTTRSRLLPRHGTAASDGPSLRCNDSTPGPPPRVQRPSSACCLVGRQPGRSGVGAQQMRHVGHHVTPRTERSPGRPSAPGWRGPPGCPWRR